jgi:hypothetical protein
MLKINLKPVAAANGNADELESVNAPSPEESDELLDASPPIPPMMRALHDALEKATSDDSRSHYKELLDAESRPMKPERRRPIIGILLAEQLNTEESRKLLEEIATGPAAAFETQVAKAALVRIRLREDTRDKTVRE